MSGVADRHMDQLARARGFPSAAAMTAFYQSRANATGPNPNQQPSLSAAFDWHPAHLLHYVLQRYNQATGQGQ